jgi:hypothetical protein
MNDATLEFYFEGGRVGFFQTTEFPREPGVYPYTPYRSGSHLRMHTKRCESGRAECSYMTDEGIVRFSVIGCPEYGRLELRDFKFGPGVG